MNNKNSELKFLKLTPESDENIEVYEEALDYALAYNNDINNIALTGGYGTGKSTIINSYIKTANLKSFMYVHLGSFEKFNIESEDFDSNEKLGNIEEKIISQILHQTPSKYVPKSIFKIKEKDKFFETFSIVISILVTCLISIYLFFPDNINILKSLYGDVNTFYKKFLFIIFCYILGYFVYKTIKIQKSSTILKKLRFYGNEIEIGDKQENSYFDKHMSDVIYLFLNCKKNIFIFEDLDRFNEPRIFEKLIEINTLLNKHHSKEMEYKFIYLLRDDIFTSKDRTKIFDFIIPIIPIIAYGNSSHKFKSLLKELNLSDEFDMKVIEKILIYIDDMRVLKNIVNEYIIYKSKIKIEFSKTKLLSILVYKNIFPNDFYLFQYGNSFIDIIYKQKNEMLNERIKKIDEEIDILSNKIDLTKTSLIENINEVLALHFNFNKYYEMKVNGKKIDDYASNTDFIKAVRDNKNIITYKSNPPYANIETIDLSNEFDRIQSLITIENYPQLNGRIEKLNKKIIELKIEKENSYNVEVKDLIIGKDKNYFVGLAEANEEFIYLKDHQYFDLILFLINESLIDRNSLDYISVQEDEDLSINDRIFLRKLFDRESNLELYNVENPSRVLEKLNEKDIIKYKITNLNIIEFVVENKQEDNLKDILSVCHINRNYDPILKYFVLISKDNMKEEFFIKVLYNNSVIEEVFTYSSEDLIEKFVNTLLVEIESEFTHDLYKIEIVKTIIEKIKVDESNIHGIISKLHNFTNNNYKFYNIDLYEKNKGQYLTLLENNLIKITENNILKIFNVFNLYIDNKERYLNNITFLYQINNQHVLEYFLNKNLNEYMKIYLKTNKIGKFNDEFWYILNIMNNEKLDSNLMLEYINNMDGTRLCKNLITVPSFYIDEIIGNGLFTLNDDNLEFIFSNYLEIPTSLSEKISNLNDYDIEINLSEQNNIKFIEYLFDEFEIIKIREVIDCITKKIIDITQFKEHNSKVLLLLEKNLIEFNTTNILFLTENYSKEIFEDPSFIDIHLDNYLTNEILSNDNIDISYKKKVMLKNISSIELSKILEYIDQFNMNKNLIEVLKRKTRRVEATESNKIILNHFIKLNIITKFEEDSETNEYYISGRDLSKNEEYSHINLDIYL
ncbi:hypothetical protein ACMGE5_01365 [Macrococcus equi]|uniref:YobI family P-loop NTPase n=1 Tax=Macrococcus equi TaxID=3395462 RepID=UPI0039BDF44A